LSKPLNLYAQWKEAVSNNYQAVVFFPNGGEGSYQVEFTDKFGQITITDKGVKRNGYIFDSWNTDSNGSGVKYTAGQTVTLNNALILYAQWASASLTYSIIYSPGIGGAGGHTDSGITAGSQYTIKNETEAKVSKPTENFMWWNTDIDGKGTKYYPGDIITVNENITLYAIWMYAT
jgi:uncharacterized repeat protein (TIGR02543 family)